MSSQGSLQIGRATAIPFRCISNKYQPNIVNPWLVTGILCTLPIEEFERDEFIQFCRAYCQEKDWLDQVSLFQHRYRPDQAIQWYTQPSGFLSKLINTICRTQNPFLISKIRYFLKHVHDQLAHLYTESLTWIPNSITVYRGQKLSLKEFKRLADSRGKQIFTTTLLSTTSCREVAAAFSGCNNSLKEGSENVISVVWNIRIQTGTTRSKPFAYIQEHSHIKDEKEILLAIGTIFSCVDIRQRDTNFYEIFLIRGRDEEEAEKKLMRTAIESYDPGARKTVNEFLISMNISIQLLDNFHRQPLTSLLDETSSDLTDEISIAVRSTDEENPTSDAEHDHLIIWLDRYIGENTAHYDLKHSLSNAIDITSNRLQDVDGINRLIQVNNAFPPNTHQLFVVTTIDECLALIHEHCQKKIFLITSGTFGREIVPSTITFDDPLHSFSSNIAAHTDRQIIMQSSASLSSISSTTSSNSSTYGSRTILDVKDLHLAAPRCRSSIVAFLDHDQTVFSPSSSPPPPPPPPRRRSQIPSANKSMAKCRHLFRTCLSSSSSPLALPIQTKLSSTVLRKQYFNKLRLNHRLLLVLNDYACQCGCHFTMKKGSFVILYEANDQSSSKTRELVTVISSELVCSKIPSEYVCDVDVLRERVRTRRLLNDDEQSFDL